MTNVRSMLLASAASLVIAGLATPSMAADQILNGAISSAARAIGLAPRRAAARADETPAILAGKPVGLANKEWASTASTGMM